MKSKLHALSIFLFFAITFNVLSQNNITYEFDNYGNPQQFLPEEIEILSVEESPNIKNTLMAKVLVIDMGPDDSSEVVRFEYFFNTDPGEGKGTSSFFAPPNDNIYEIDGISSKGVGAKCGLNTLYIRAKDGNGKWSYAVSQPKVDVPDSSSPVVDGFEPPKSLQLNDQGQAVLNISDIKYKVSDNCSKNVKVKFCKNISSPNQLTFTCADIGSKTINICFEDDNGNNTIKNFSLEINEKTKPKVLTKDITVDLNNEGKVIISPQDVNNGSSDNCSKSEEMTFKLNKTNFDCNDIGNYIVELKVVDKSGNEETQSAKVTIADNIPPTVEAKNITKALSENGTVAITPEEVISQASDNCSSPLTYELDKSTFTCDDIGDVEVILTVSDKSGNKTSSKVTITITGEGSMPDSVPTKAATIFLDKDGKAKLKAEQVYDETNPSNCVITELSIAKEDFDCSNLGYNSVNLTISNGKEKLTKPASVTVKDTIKPKVSVKEDVVVYLDSQGKALIGVNDVKESISDNCKIKESRINIVDGFNCENLGDNKVQLQVWDESENFVYANTNVAVKDTISPIIKTKSIDVKLDDNGFATIKPSDVDAGSSDNCNLTLSLNKTTFSCTEGGKDIEVILTGTDNSGNTASKTAIVKVTGTGGLPDVVPTKNISIELSEEGKAKIIPQDVYDDKNSKNCFVSGMSVDKDDFSCEEIGKEVEVILTIENGNLSKTGKAIVTVVDNTKPTVNAKDLILDLKGETELVITASDIDTGSSDNCSIESKKISLDRFKRTGDYPITYTVTDASGNEASTSVLVKVIDSTITDGVSIQQNSDGETITILYDNIPQRLSVYNILGQQMFQTFTVPKTMHVAHLGSGLYFFNFVTSSGEKALLKVLVK